MKLHNQVIKRENLRMRHLLAATLLCLTVSSPVSASVLKGGVQLQGAGTRLSRSTGLQTSNSVPTAPPVRLSRLSGGARDSGLIDTSQFAALPARADSTAPLSGSAQAANNKFDIGAERNSRTLTLAWDAWHKQLSAEIYARWSRVASVRGRATMRVTVTRDHHVIAQLINPSGNWRFDNDLLDVINSLDNNPGLSFPAGSQRQSVSFEADYIADSNIQGGYSWTHNDYEQVNQSY
jgi:hypothetical protein